METTADKFMKTIRAKSRIESSLIAKGQDPTGLPFEDYYTKIDAIKQDPKTQVDSNGSCTGLVPFDLIDDKIISISNSAFEGYSVKSISLINCTNIYDFCFRGCRLITTINLPLITNIPSYCFTSCTSLTSINIPLVNTIGHLGLSNCESLEILDLPSLTNLNANGISGCKSLKQLIIRTNQVCILNNGDLNTINPYLKIYVPDNLLEDYKIATNWVACANKIMPLSQLPTN